jgi:hypothetical protein
MARIVIRGYGDLKMTINFLFILNPKSLNLKIRKSQIPESPIPNS